MQLICEVATDEEHSQPGEIDQQLTVNYAWAVDYLDCPSFSEGYGSTDILMVENGRRRATGAWSSSPTAARFTYDNVNCRR
jgi:hypothetical protein